MTATLKVHIRLQRTFVKKILEYSKTRNDIYPKYPPPIPITKKKPLLSVNLIVILLRKIINGSSKAALW